MVTSYLIHTNIEFDCYGMIKRVRYNQITYYLRSNLYFSKINFSDLKDLRLNDESLYWHLKFIHNVGFNCDFSIDNLNNISQPPITDPLRW